MKNNVIKGLIILIVAFIFSYICARVEGRFNLKYALVSTIIMEIAYFTKNAEYNSVNRKDILN